MTFFSLQVFLTSLSLVHRKDAYLSWLFPAILLKSVIKSKDFLVEARHGGTHL